VIPEKHQAVTDLVNDLTFGKTTLYAKVFALYTYFTKANGFHYELSTKRVGGGSDIEAFLRNKQGYCEQYAAALAWMVRTAGIPARVAFGFTRGGNRQGQTYSLTNLNLHAWTEVYFSGFGWVPFDATPAVTGTATTAWAPDPNHPTPVVGGPSTNPSGGPTPTESEGPDLGPKKTDQRGTGVGGAIDFRDPSASWPWYLLGAGLVLLALLSLPALRRSGLRRRRLRSKADGATPTVTADGATGPPGEMRLVVSRAELIQEAHAAWDELVDTLVDYGIPTNEAETPRETARRVARSLVLVGPPVEALTLIGQVEERARYARTPLGSGKLATALRVVRSAVAASASRRTRLRAALFPRSVLLRWRERVGTGSANAIAALDRWWESVTRAVSPRRLLPGRSTR
jgi:Transglutaminase-like superfamily/Domain of unknown function (DUF4129)